GEVSWHTNPIAPTNVDDTMRTQVPPLQFCYSWRLPSHGNPRSRAASRRPTRLWSVTAYDAATRSEVQTLQNKAALRSMFELKDTGAAKSVDLYFGPKAPSGQEGRWVQTIPGQGWFTYFRTYGPQGPAFDGS